MTALSGMKEICGYFKRSESTILQLIRDCRFPAIKLGGIWESDTEEVDRWRKQWLRDEVTPKYPVEPVRNSAGKREKWADGKQN